MSNLAAKACARRDWRNSGADAKRVFKGAPAFGLRALERRFFVGRADWGDSAPAATTESGDKSHALQTLARHPHPSAIPAPRLGLSCREPRSHTPLTTPEDSPGIGCHHREPEVRCVPQADILSAGLGSILPREPRGKDAPRTGRLIVRSPPRDRIGSGILQRPRRSIRRSQR